jgi:hypothetical protein
VATDGCALISERSWSRAARQSTRTAETAALLNSSAASGPLTAAGNQHASRRTTNLPSPDFTATPPGACP